MFQYPYGDTQQLNLDWLMEQWQETKASIDGSLQGEIDRVEAAITDLLAARDAAVAAKTAAETAATSASGYASTASTAASTATAQATAAAGSAALAGSKASEAQTYATNADLDATAAGNSAAAAAVSATNAGNSETSAASYSSAAAGNALYAEGMAKGTQNGTPVTSDSPYYENNAAYWAGEAQRYQGYSEQDAEYAEAMAKGTIGGVPVSSGDPGYHDNASYYKDEAAAQAAAAAASAASADGTNAQKMIAAPEEASSTASAAHAAGTYFRYNSKLYKATQDIALGGTITPNTNCVEDTVCAELTAQSEQISYITLDTKTDTSKWSQGYWAIANGTENTDSGTWIKTKDFLPDSIIEIYDNANLLLYLQAWDKTSGNYIGTWNGSQLSTTYTSGTGLLELDIVHFRKIYPNYKFKITVTASDSSSINPTTNGGQIYFAESKVAKQQDELDAQAEQINNIVTHVSGSKNLLDYTKTIANKYLNPNGTLEDLNGRYVTDYVPVVAGKYVVFGYVTNTTAEYTRQSYSAICLYDENKNVVSGGDYNKSSFLVPNSVAYVRATLGSSQFTTKYSMAELTDDGNITSFVFYVGDGTEHLSNDIVVPDKKLGYMQAKGNLTDGQSLTLPYHNVKNNNVLTFVANITTFDKLKIGKEDTDYITIDDTNVVITNANGTFTKAHGLTIQDDIQVVIENETSNNASLIRLASSGNVYEVDGTYAFYMDSGRPYAVSDGSTLTDCIFTWTSRNINKPIWLFGDSYFSWYDSRWTYYLRQDGFTDSCMLNGFAGEDSMRAFNGLVSLLNVRTPQYVVWCLGMNNGDYENSVNTEWYRVYCTLVALSDMYGFELILATIPNTSTVNNAYKNAIVRESGYRYIDFAKAVDPDDDGVWFDGTEDNSHPTVRGAIILYHQVLADLPEITSK